MSEEVEHRTVGQHNRVQSQNTVQQPNTVRKQNIVLLFGGKSTEHAVSIRSAASIYQALSSEKYNIIPVGISSAGQWITGAAVLESLARGTPLPDSAESISLLPDPNTQSLVEVRREGESSSSFTSISPEPIDVVFPVLHGRYGEDGTLQGLLDMANVPYVGCGVIGSVLGMDKGKQKEIFAYHGIPIVRFLEFRRSEWDEDSFDLTTRIETHFQQQYPLFVKPANTGSSVGISKAKNQSELNIAIEEAFRYDHKVVVEEGKDDIREIEVAILGNDRPEASVCGEIVPSNEFYDYAAKYIDDRSQVIIPADLSLTMSNNIRKAAIKAYRALDCRGLSRVDFFVSRSGTEYWLNEINTLPGFTSISMYPKLWEASGLDYPALIEKLISLAIEDWRAKQRLQTSSYSS